MQHVPGGACDVTHRALVREHGLERHRAQAAQALTLPAHVERRRERRLDDRGEALLLAPHLDVTEEREGALEEQGQLVGELEGELRARHRGDHDAAPELRRA